MNKYQDFDGRHIKTKSFVMLPSIRQLTAKSCKNSQEGDNFEYKTIQSSSSGSFNRKKMNQSISEFSQSQNEKIYSYLSPSSAAVGKLSVFPDINLKQSGISERDFSNLISSINEIITPKGIKKTTVLLDDESVDVFIEEGMIKHFKCFVKGRYPPLSIKIKRRSGKLNVFTSTEVHEPGPGNCSKCFTNDYIEIREPGKFKYEAVFIGIKAVLNSDFQITVNFGSRMGLKEIQKIKRELKNTISSSILESEESDEKIEEKQKCLKDFILENKNKQGFNSILKAELLTERAEAWKIRREQAVSKKKSLVETKKNNALHFLNKKSVKEKQEKVEKKVRKEKDKKTQKSRIWISFIYIAKSLETIYNSFKALKAKKLDTAFLIRKVMVIQRAFRKFKHGLDMRDIQIIRCKSLLMIFTNTTRSIFKQKSHEDLISFISYTANTFRVFNKFSTFFRRITIIQRNIRLHLARKELFIKELSRHWNMACEHFLFKKSSGKKNHRRHASLKIISIPKNVKNAVLEEFYQTVVQRFKKDAKNRDQNMNEEKKVFRTIISGFLQKSFMFQDYLPTRRQLEKLIEAVLKRMEEGYYKIEE